MSHEFDPETGEILASPQLRSTVMSVLPALPIDKQLHFSVKFPLHRPLLEIGFVNISYTPVEIYLDVVEAEALLDDEERVQYLEALATFTPVDVPEYHGLQRRCVINHLDSEIDIYYETTGTVDINKTTFTEDERDRTITEDVAPEPKTPNERLHRAIFGPPQSEEAVQAENAYWDLQRFTQDKLEALYGFLGELGIERF